MPLGVDQFPFQLGHPVPQSSQVRVVLLVPLLELHGEKALVSLELVDLLLGAVVFPLQNLQLGLKTTNCYSSSILCVCAFIFTAVRVFLALGQYREK